MTRLLRSHAASMALAILLVGQAASGWAGSFDVNPIRVELSAQSRSGALTLRNGGTEKVVVQASSFAWSQQNGQDALTNTNDLLVSPPIVTIAPGAQQIIRVGLRRQPDENAELSYRIFLQEVPPPPQPGFQGLLVTLKVGLPVFVAPRTGQARANLVWTADLKGGNALRLKVQNTGNAHIQIGAIDFFQRSGGDAVAQFTTPGYVLKGQGRDWEVGLKPGSIRKGDRLKMKISTDSGEIESEIEIGEI